MAQATTNIAAGRPSFFDRLGNFLVKMAENNTRMRRVQKLQSMSDAQLAEIGLRRDQILQHVYADMMHV